MVEMKNSDFFGTAITTINPEAEYVIRGEAIYENIEWVNGTTPIAEADILAKQDELIAEYDAKQYQRDRKAEYPTIEELVVALYDTEDKLAIENKRAEVKARFPKNE